MMLTFKEQLKKTILQFSSEINFIYARNSSGKTRCLKNISYSGWVKVFGVSHNSVTKPFKIKNTLLKNINNLHKKNLFTTNEEILLKENEKKFKEFLTELGLSSSFHKNIYVKHNDGSMSLKIIGKIFDDFSTSERQKIMTIFTILFSSPSSTIIFDDIKDGMDKINLLKLFHKIIDLKNPNQKIIFLSKDKELHKILLTKDKELLKKSIKEWNGKEFFTPNIDSRSPYNDNEINSKFGLIYWISIYFESTVNLINNCYKKIFDSIFLHLDSSVIDKNEIYLEIINIIPEKIKSKAVFQEIFKNNLTKTFVNWNNTIGNLSNNLTWLKNITEKNIHHYFLVTRTLIEKYWRENLINLSDDLEVFNSFKGDMLNKQKYFINKTKKNVNFLPFILIANEASHKFFHYDKIIVDTDLEEQKKFIIETVNLIKKN